MFRKKLSIIVLCVVVGVLLLGFGYNLSIQRMTKKFLAGRSNIQAVAAAPVSLKNWGRRVDAVGTFTATQGIDVVPEVPGIVVSIPFVSGSSVRKGDLLIGIEDTQDKAALSSATANKDLAKINYRRMSVLYDKGAVSKDKLDQALANLKSAQADVTAKQDMVAKKNIVAPFSGKLGIRKVSLGQYLAPGTPVVSLYSLNPIYVDFTVTEDVANVIKEHQPVFVTVDAFKNKEFGGHILGREPRSDPNTHTVMFRAAISNRDNVLFPGLFGRVRIDFTKKERYLVVPKPAISYAPYGASVYVLKPDKNYTKKASDTQIKGNVYIAQQTFVKLGEERENLVVVTAGVNEGDLVVTAGQIKIKNNAQVYISDDAVQLAQEVPKLEEGRN